MNDTEKIYCCECGEELQGAMYHIGCDDYICEDCRNNYYSYCEHCGTLVPNEEITDVDNNRRFVCSTAPTTITSAALPQPIQPRQHRRRYSLLNLVRRLLRRSLFHLRRLRRVYHQDEAEYIGGCVYCITCANGHEACILPYSTKPEPVFFGDGEAGYGVELEIDNGIHRQDAARDIINAGKDHVYVKEDGSLSRDGMEIVTHPATLDYHVNHFPWTEI